MSARLNMNELAYFSWKGTTFNQLTTNTQKNTNTTILSKYNLKLAQPLKIYRKEIVSAPISACSRRMISIDEMNQPNGALLSTAHTHLGMLETIDFNLTTNSTERPGTCSALSSNGVCLDPARNALKRCRSSGNLKKNYDITRNNDIYYTSTKQYLESRNRLFAQNQFNYLRKGDLATMPGSPTTYENVYSPQGLNHCAGFKVTSEISFKYQWANGSGTDITTTTVTIPAATYTSIQDINKILIQTMTTNQHYYINNSTGTSVYLLNIGYDNVKQKVVLQTFFTNTTIFPFGTSGQTYNPANSGDTISTTTTYGPYFIIDSPSIISLFGITAGSYPNSSTDMTSFGSATSSSTFSTMPPQLSGSIYVPLYYKPNNYQYAQQGAVTSSSRITRLKYNTISKNALKFRQSLGNATGNALAYSTRDAVYTIKDKTGFPNRCTPIFNKYSDTMKRCMVNTIVNHI